MKINALLTERAIIQEQILADSTYREFYKLGILLREYAMDQQQIQQLFRQVADGAAAGGNVAQAGDAPASNRTVMGKGADVAGKVADAYRGLKDAIGKTGPVKGIDAMIDSAQTQIMQAAGGESGRVGQALEFYRELSRVPGMAMAVKIAVLGLAGLAGSGLGPIGIAAGLTFANKMLQGDKFSSSVMGALETGGTVAAIQTAKDLLGTTHVGADYGDADDQSFGPIDKTNPDPLAGVDPNNIYRPTPDPLDANDNNSWDNEPADNNLPNADAASNNQADVQAAQDWVNADAAGKAEIEKVTGMPAAQLQDIAAQNDLVANSANSAGGDLAGQFSGGQYEVVKGDQLGRIAQAMGVGAEDIKALNPQINWAKPLQPGMTLELPPQGDGTGSVWQGYTGGVYGDKAPSSTDMDAVSDRANNLFKMQQDADAEYYKNKPDDFGVPPRSNDAVGDGMPKAQPVVPGTPSDGSYRQSAPLGADGKPMKQMASKINTGNMIREYIDIDTTARMWMLRESIGKPRGGVYLTNEGVQAVFKEVASRFMVNEGPWLDKLKGFNKKASDAIGKVTKPLGDIARAGWDSATNKITYRDLDLNWRRSAKLDKEASVDSEQVKQFLKAQGVEDPLINSSFKALGLDKGPMGTPADPTTAKTAEPTPTKATEPAAKTTTATKPVTPTVNKSAGVGFNASNITNMPGMSPTWADPKSKDYVGRREVARRQQAQMPALGTTYPNKAQPPKATEPQGTSLDLDQLKAQRAAKQAQGQADQQAAMAQMKAKADADAAAKPQWTGRQKVSADGNKVFESRVDFSLILLNKMLGQKK